MSSPPPARRIGRILSLGIPMPGTRVDNYNFLSAPSFFDYDAMVVDVRALTHLVEEVTSGELEPETFSRGRVRRVAEAPDEVALSDMLARRAEETKRLLANNGVVVLFADVPAALPTGLDAHALSNYCWLPAPDGASYETALVAADGTQTQIVDYEHPMAPFVLGQLANIAYRVRLDADAMHSIATPPRVFARSYGGAVIGAEAAVGNGRVVLLPALKSMPAGEARYALSETLQSCVRRMIGVMAEGRAPSWLAQHPLPGLDERAAALESASRDDAAAKRALEEAQAAHDALARYQALLWQEGALGLEPVVADALRLIGFELYDQRPDEIEIKAGDVNAMVEIDASDGPVGMAAHYRLRQRIERAIERRSAVPRGVLFVNGHRLVNPHDRPPQASDALRLAAETMRYCVAPTTSLFEAVRASLAGDEVAVASFRRDLLQTDGLIEAQHHE